MAVHVELNEANFDEEVLNADLPVLIDFWAEWCAPCKMVAPAVEEIAEEYNGKIKVGKLNVDVAAQVAARYGIRSIPTLMVFKDGRVADQVVGAVPKGQISSMVDKVIA